MSENNRGATGKHDKCERGVAEAQGENDRARVTEEQQEDRIAGQKRRRRLWRENTIRAS